MAQGSKSTYSVYGSLAYDLCPERCEYAAMSSMVKAASAKRTKRRKAAHAPALAVVMVLTGTLLLAGLMAQSSLVELSDKTVSVKAELDELLAEQRKLKIEHAGAFVPEETERYAIDVLGMRKPGADQIYYIDVQSSQGTELDAADNADGHDLLSIICEYLPG